MSYVTDTNHFFKTNVYPKFADFAFSPVSWAFKESEEEKRMFFLFSMLRAFDKLLVAALCAPILIPATVVTSGIALALAAVTAVVHGLSLLGAAIIDYLNTPCAGCVDDEETITNPNLY